MLQGKKTWVGLAGIGVEILCVAAVALAAPTAVWVLALMVGTALVLTAFAMGEPEEAPSVQKTTIADAGVGDGDIRGNVFGDNARVTISHGDGHPEAPIDRDMVRLSVSELVAIYQEHTEIQAVKLAEPYLGGWLKIEAPLENVSNPQWGDGYRVSVFVDGHLVSAFFVPEAQGQLQRLRRGDPIALVGRIRDIGLLGVDLENCELLEVG